MAVDVIYTDRNYNWSLQSKWFYDLTTYGIHWATSLNVVLGDEGKGHGGIEQSSLFCKSESH